MNPMMFSEYIVLENPGSSVDPLGFLRPSAALADYLFKQFTVLSNHPSYHGFLCFLYLYLEKKGIKPGKNFSKEFRHLEALWGLLNSRADQSILNVTKYDELLEKGYLSLGETKKYLPLYARLNYGTLGHYSSPSIFWGLLNLKGTELTPLGVRLGLAWQKRGGKDFASLLDAWTRQESHFDASTFTEVAALFHIEASPSVEEVQAWRDIIQAYCDKYPIVRPLWKTPVPEHILGLQDSVEKFHGFYPGVLEHFSGQVDLHRRIGLAQQFELLAGSTQFLFEWEYARRTEEGQAAVIPYTDMHTRIVADLPTMAEAYLKVPEFRDTGNLFKTMALSKGTNQIPDVILTHHARHQKSKGASAYIQDQDIVVRDRLDLKVFAALLLTLSANADQWTTKVAWHYKRDWHFNRADKWLKYAGGAL
jgi:hypothetical protein